MTAQPDLNHLLALPAEDRLDPLVQLAGQLASRVELGESVDQSLVYAAREALVALVEDFVGDGNTRMRLGDCLGRLGDPRLKLPENADYWATVKLDGLTLSVARYPVTVYEWQLWVDAGGYRDDAAWTAEGRDWRDSGVPLWPKLATEPGNALYLIPNLPVIGVTWYEAMAYARASGARLPEHAERREIVRGDGRRPYPWGEPFGYGNANTREEVLMRPTAVGLYRADCTPEGIYDLAGNVAEWTQDELGGKAVIHPGSWRQPSMAAWAKAIDHRALDYRSQDLGLRLVKS